MKSILTRVALIVGILVSSAVAAPPSTPAQRDLLVPIIDRDESGLAPRQSSCNTPSNRACWSNGYDINTDYEVNSPDTGVVRPVRTPHFLLA